MNQPDNSALNKGTKLGLWIKWRLWITRLEGDDVVLIGHAVTLCSGDCTVESHAGPTDGVYRLGDCVGEWVDFGGIEA
jgi:hypothetical protein